VVEVHLPVHPDDIVDIDFVIEGGAENLAERETKKNFKFR